MRKACVVAVSLAGLVGAGVLAGASPRPRAGRAVTPEQRVAPKTTPQPIAADPTVSLNGKTYRMRIGVTRTIGGIPIEGELPNVLTTVRLELIPTNGRSASIVPSTPSLVMTQGDQSTPIELVFVLPGVDEQRASLVWQGQGSNGWADDVQLRAEAFFPVGRRGARVRASAVEFRTVLLPGPARDAGQ